MKELNNNMKLETPAVTTLIGKMMEQGTTYEDFEKVLAYAISAIVADDAQISMWEAAEKTGINDICKKIFGRWSNCTDKTFWKIYVWTAINNLYNSNRKTESS